MEAAIMSVRTILALHDGGKDSEGTLQTAIAAAAHFKAHLDVLHVRADPETMVPVVGEAMTGAMVEQMMETMAGVVAERAARARTAFDRLCAPLGPQVAWQERTGREPELVSAAGRFADLTVIGRASDSGDGPMAATLDAALFETGRPVLLAPPGAGQPTFLHIAVAWDGSAQASRAVAAGLPFLRRARQVTLLAAAGGDSLAPVELLLPFLERHDVRAVIEGFAPGSLSLGRALLAQTQRIGGDLLVMGAYGHSRLREMIFGGATREVLAESTQPVLMAH
jgi:nucleotide-binding universal stress UspA family protein